MNSNIFHFLQDGDYEKIENFLQRRSDCLVSVDVKDKRTGNTPLIWASKRGHTKVHILEFLELSVRL